MVLPPLTPQTPQTMDTKSTTEKQVVAELQRRIQRTQTIVRDWVMRHGELCPSDMAYHAQEVQSSLIDTTHLDYGDEYIAHSKIAEAVRMLEHAEELMDGAHFRLRQVQKACAGEEYHPRPELENGPLKTWKRIHD